jgi:epi-isozizaene 5-monooxygenase / beta-farnesene synthase
MTIVHSKPPLAAGAKPLLGHTWSLLRDPFSFLESLRDSGDVVKIQLGFQVAYVVCSPQLVGEMLISKSDSLIVGGSFWDILESVIGKGVASSNGPLHKRQRRLIQPFFQAEKVATYAQAMAEEATTTTKKWRSGDIINFDDVMFETLVRILSRSLLVTEHLGKKAETIRKSLFTVFEGMYSRMILPN